jgi:uncharacterized protein (DUF1330 family)
MKSYYTAALGMLASFGLGAVFVQTLHAQAKPRAYFIEENEVTNADAYKNEFLSVVGPDIKANGGRYLAAGNATGLLGDAPKSRVVIIVWDNMEKLQSWYNSPEHQKAVQVGAKYAKFRDFAVPGVEE